jgi:hypothetical protein
MSTTITNLISSKVISNLDTYIYTVQTAAMHVASIAINELPPSGITVTIEQNGSPVAATSTPAAQQQVINLSATMNCAVNDTISIIVASSSPSDQGPQRFKGILNIHIGSSN